MSDYVITPADVKISGSNVRATTVVAGEAISEGQLVYLDTVSGKYKLAIATAEASANVVGVAVTSAALDGYFLMQSSRNYFAGTTLVAGDPIYLSATAGAICPHADLVSTNYVTLLGHAISTSEIEISLDVTGIAIA